MPIVASSFVLAPAPESDGRSYVTEMHIDQYDVPYPIEYLADVGADYNAIMVARATQISADLVQAELNAVLGNGT